MIVELKKRLRSSLSFFRQKVAKPNTNSKSKKKVKMFRKFFNLGIQIKDISTEQSSLESIFLNLVKESENELVRS